MINWTNQEKYIIAEFVFSNANGVLIKSDAVALLNVFDDRDLIEEDVNALIDNVDNNSAGITGKCIQLLNEHVPHAEGQKIMSDYYSGKLP